MILEDHFWKEKLSMFLFMMKALLMPRK